MLTFSTQQDGTLLPNSSRKYGSILRIGQREYGATERLLCFRIPRKSDLLHRGLFFVDRRGAYRHCGLRKRSSTVPSEFQTKGWNYPPINLFQTTETSGVSSYFYSFYLALCARQTIPGLSIGEGAPCIGSFIPTVASN